MADLLSAPKSQKTLAPVKRKPKAAKSKFKVTKFDKDVVKLIQSGVIRFFDWCQALGVDETQARARVNALVERGYLAPDPQLVGVYRLGIEGYNKYGSLKKTAATVHVNSPSIPSPASPLPATPAPMLETLLSKTSAERKERPAVPSRPPVASRPPALPAPVRRFADDGTVTDDAVPKARTEMDLAEMLQRGSPANKRRVDGAICELCRGEFKVSIKEPKLAKFAHCTCGSAYHSDCYHSLVEGGAGCARCGRKLSAVLDQSSQDSLKDIKDAFE